MIAVLFQDAEQRTSEIQRAVDAVFLDPALKEGLSETHAIGVDVWVVIWDLVIESIGQFAAWLVGLRGDSPFLFWLIMGALVLVLVLLIAHIIWSIAVAFRASTSRDPASVPPEHARRMATFKDLRTKARALASSGSFREAVHALLLAVLTAVEERRVLQVMKGWTNREIFKRLNFAGEANEHLNGFEATVEEVSYGAASMDRAGFDRLDGEAEHVVASLNVPQDDKGRFGLASGARR